MNNSDDRGESDKFTQFFQYRIDNDNAAASTCNPLPHNPPPPPSPDITFDNK